MKRGFLLLIFLLLPPAGGFSSEIPDEKIALFSRFTGNYVLDDMLKKSEMRIMEMLDGAGRFMPAEYNRKMEYLKRAEGKDAYGLFRNTAADMGLDLYIVLEGAGRPGSFRMTMKVFALNSDYRKLESTFSFSASLPENIPLKAARETARLMSGVRLRAEVISSGPGGRAVIDAGQWHGLAEGSCTSDSGEIKIVETARFTSVIYAPDLKRGDKISFDLFPSTGPLIEVLEKEMTENVVNRYGPDSELNKRRGAARESVFASCIINPGASIFLPGYGSFLSMEYLGLKNSEMDSGVFAGAFLVAGHLLLPSAMTGFDINFLPWIQDSDKTDRVKRLQIFLWATLPAAYTASFYDQLSSQYTRRGMVPPLFEHRDNVAALASLFVPGGGLFYKGYRSAAWTFYFAEMGLAGYGLYNLGDDRGKYSLAALGAVKLADIAMAFLVDPSYGAYRKNSASNDHKVRFSMDAADVSGMGSEFRVSAVLPF